MTNAKHGIALLLSIAIVLLSGSSIGGAVNAYIRPSTFNFHTDYVPGRVNVITGSIDLKNIDTFNVVVDLNATGNLAGITHFLSDPIVLEPGEKRQAYFLIFLQNYGFYSGSISVAYRKELGWSLPNVLAADVSISAHLAGSGGGGNQSCGQSCPNVSDARLLKIESDISALRNDNGNIWNAIHHAEAVVSGINNTLKSVSGLVGMVKNAVCYLFSSINIANPFWSCGAPSAITCSTNAGCGANGYLGSDYCMNGDVYRNYHSYACNNPGNTNSYCSESDTPVLKEDCTSSCAGGKCSGPSGKVIFRTNAKNGDYAYGTWIAYDVDGDGDLDMRIGRYKQTINKPCPACLFKDFFGKCVVVYEGMPLVKTGETVMSCEYRKYDSYYQGGEASQLPTEPYASNHQEVYSS